MDILRKSIAPIADAAWDQINEQAKEIFNALLTARQVVDVDGPKGWKYNAVPLGRLKLIEDNHIDVVGYGINQVLPLAEARISFKLNLWELDYAVRGAEDIDLGSLEEAAKKIALFEENAIYYGSKDLQIKGLIDSSEHKPIAFSKNMQDIMLNIATAISTLKDSAIEGPYTLIINSDKWNEIISQSQGYPFNKHISDILGGGKVIASPHIKKAFVVSERGGDFKLTIGQDLSIGYEEHDSKEVQLYFTESFTFRVLEPKAVIVFD